MNMKIVTFLLTLSFLAALVSCATEEIDLGVRKLFNALSENAREYNDLLRSNQFDKARIYVNESLREEFDRKAKGVTIIDSRLLDRDFRELNKGREHLKIEIDYSISPSSEIKTVLDNQTWDYTSTGVFKQKKVWMLTTTLPEFK